MVSIHNTLVYHNYLNELKEPSPLQVNNNTILKYIFDNYENVYNSIKDNSVITNRLNNQQLSYTLFLKNDPEYNILDYIVSYPIILDNDNYRILNINNLSLIIHNNKINNYNITNKNIKIGNSIIHIIN